MTSKSIKSRIKDFFYTSDQNKLFEEDKSRLQDITDIKPDKKDKSKNPTPVYAKAVHAGMVYNPSISTKNGEEMYTPQEYNLSVVANCLDTDSYFRRSIEKYVELMWKNGYSFYGKNPNAVSYIRKRFEQIAMVTLIPTDQLFRDIGYQLVCYSNVYISKVRNDRASGGRSRTDFTGQELAPVAGYFIEDSVSMQLAVKENGEPIGYKQVIPGARKTKVWKPWNIIHMVHSRKPGLRVGTPMVWPVLDDIRALRRIEQNVELLVFQHTIPLFQYIVGTESRPAQPDEITSVKQTVEKMPPNGCVVTPERHKIEAIGVSDGGIDASIYLEYYKNRVLSGLGMSGVGMGEGGTSNRGTAVVLDKHLVNTTSMFQQILKMYIDEFMIKELLAEGGFETSYIDEDNKVGIIFPPIDTEEQRAKENHYAQMYNQYAITEDELRKEMGREPVKDNERERDYFELIVKPLEMIKAKLSEETAINVGNAKPILTKTANGATKVNRAQKSAANKEQPTNQHGKLTSKPRFAKNDEIEDILSIIKDTTDDVVDACIDFKKEAIDISSKVSTIKKYNFETSKQIILEKKLKSNLEDREIIYNKSIQILDELYSRFESMKDYKHVDDVAIRMTSLTDTLNNRLEIYMLNEYNNVEE